DEEYFGNNNQPPPRDNANIGNLGIDNNNDANANSNAPNHLENKKVRLVAKLTKDIKRISPPKFNGTTMGVGSEKWLSEMEKYFSIRNFSKETKEIWGAYNISHE
ncbi:hypothetical protein KI387_031558, partial [Taxus chinensis]